MAKCQYVVHIDKLNLVILVSVVLDCFADPYVGVGLCRFIAKVLAVVFTTFDSSFETNLFSAGCIEIGIFEVT